MNYIKEITSGEQSLAPLKQMSYASANQLLDITSGEQSLAPLKQA